MSDPLPIIGKHLCIFIVGRFRRQLPRRLFHKGSGSLQHFLHLAL